MIVTEEEAKTKRCQESFAAHGGYTDIMREDEVIEAPRNCIGSACMAWRWKRGSLYMPDPLQTNHFTEYEGKGEYSASHGYCGKAGKP